MRDYTAAELGVRHGFISALIITAQCGYGADVDPFVGLCRETWGEEALLDALKDLPHGAGRRTRLMCAAGRGDVARMQWLLKRGARVGCRDMRGRRALHFAGRSGSMEGVGLLLAAGAELDCRAAYNDSPLSEAAGEGHLGVVLMLLARGADAGVGAGPLYGPLHAACTGGHLAVSRALIACGADIDREVGGSPCGDYIGLHGTRP